MRRFCPSVRIADHFAGGKCNALQLSKGVVRKQGLLGVLRARRGQKLAVGVELVGHAVVATQAVLSVVGRSDGSTSIIATGAVAVRVIGVRRYR